MKGVEGGNVDEEDDRKPAAKPLESSGGSIEYQRGSVSRDSLNSLDVDYEPEPAVASSDGGLGGIGRALERNANADANINGEDSSLATARDFLSRLLLMLAAFVILCLLLF